LALMTVVGTFFETRHKEAPTGHVPNQSRPPARWLLSLLWQRGSMTLSEVREAMNRSVGYATVQTRLNRLVDNRLAAKRKESRTTSPHPTLPRRQQPAPGRN
jgi:hypothetical protein